MAELEKIEDRHGSGKVHSQVENWPDSINEGYGAADKDSEDRIVGESLHCPNNRTVATASKVTRTHIPPSCANCRVI